MYQRSEELSFLILLMQVQISEVQKEIWFVAAITVTKPAIPKC